MIIDHQDDEKNWRNYREKMAEEGEFRREGDKKSLLVLGATLFVFLCVAAIVYVIMQPEKLPPTILIGSGAEQKNIVFRKNGDILATVVVKYDSEAEGSENFERAKKAAIETNAIKDEEFFLSSSKKDSETGVRTFFYDKK